jgi:hypothetical protein
MGVMPAQGPAGALARGAWAAPEPKRRGWVLPLAVIAALFAVGGAGVAVAVLVHKGSGRPAHAGTAVIHAGAGTATGAPAVVGTVSIGTTTAPACDGNGELPCQSGEQMRAAIQSLLYTWHEDVVQGNYRGAWNLLSERKRQEELNTDGYATWKKNQSTLNPYLDPSGIEVSIVSTEPSTGEATVEVTGMTWDAPGASCSEWSGITWVLYEDEGWRYDPGYSTTPQREAEYKNRYPELLGGSC